MTIRYYVMPTTENPKYPIYMYHGRWNTGGVNCPWAMIDYGSINECVVCADVTTANHTSLIAHSDVLAIPVNIDSTLTVSARNSARNFCETYNIPGGWINTGMTYRYVLRIITAFFLYLQRVYGILGHSINFPSGWMDLQYQQIPADIQAAMLQAAVEQGFDTSGLQPTTTIRIILKFMADEWGATPILFGIGASL